MKYKGIHTMAEVTGSTSYIPIQPTKRHKLLLRERSVETKINKDWSKTQALCSPPAFLLGLAPLPEIIQFWGGGLF